MNLRNIYILCRDNYDAIAEIKVSDLTINNRAMKRLSGWDEARNAATNLMKVDFLKEESEKLVNSVPAIYVMKNIFDIGNDEWNKINRAKNNLLLNIDVVIQLYESMGLEDTERMGLDVKLPTYHDFSEYVKCVNDIEFVLTKCPYLNISDEKIEFSNVDVGSNWLTFVIVGTIVTGTSVILNNLAAFIDKCIIIRSHYLSMKKQKLEIEESKKEKNEKEIILKYVDEMYKKQVDFAIEEMQAISGYKMENKDGDEKRRIEECFLKMGGLIDKGLQIYMSLDSPKEAQVLFEPLEMKYISVAENLKMLEEKSEE